MIGLLITASADRDIVFAAQHYRIVGYGKQDKKSPQTPILEYSVGVHLFRMNSDGSDRLQITFGNCSDREPAWSPDGKWIAYIRYNGRARGVLCLVDEDGKHTRSLHQFTDDEEFFHRFEWSPDGKFIALVVSRFKKQDQLYVIPIDTGATRTMSPVEDFAWSPDSRNLALHNVEYSHKSTVDSFRILDLKTGKTVAYPLHVWAPVWLDKDIIVGADVDPTNHNGDYSLHTISIKGFETNRLDCRDITDISMKNNFGILSWRPDARWHIVSRAERTAIRVSSMHYTGGADYGIWFIDLKNSTKRLVATEMLVGVSPDASSIVIASHANESYSKRKWYKYGPIQLVNLNSGKVKSLTNDLMSVSGGDWRKPPAKTSRRTL